MSNTALMHYRAKKTHYQGHQNSTLLNYVNSKYFDFLVVISPVGYFKKTATSSGSGTNLVVVYKRIRKIIWFSGNPPKDHPTCGFQGEYCPQLKKKEKSNRKLIN